MHIELTSKQRKLLSDILSLILILDCLYAVFTFVFESQMQIFKFLASGSLITIAMIAIFVMFVFNLFIKRKTLTFTTNTNRQQQKNDFKPRRTQNQQNTTQYTKPKTKRVVGSSMCPKCKRFTIGATCKHCGWRLVWK